MSIWKDKNVIRESDELTKVPDVVGRKQQQKNTSFAQLAQIGTAAVIEIESQWIKHEV